MVGLTDRLALPQKYLEFCGSFPIYNIEESSSDSMMLSLMKGRIDIINVCLFFNGCFNVLMSKVKKYNCYMPAGSKTNLGGSCIYYTEE